MSVSTTKMTVEAATELISKNGFKVSSDEHVMIIKHTDCAYYPVDVLSVHEGMVNVPSMKHLNSNKKYYNGLLKKELEEEKFFGMERDIDSCDIM